MADSLALITDAGVSLGVVIAGIAIMFTGWLWLDPVLSLVIVAVILVSTWGLHKDSVNLSMDAVPSDVNVSEIKKYFLSLTEVREIHALHVWAISTTENALTVHLLCETMPANNDLLEKIEDDMHHLFSIEHSTVQIKVLQVIMYVYLIMIKQKYSIFFTYYLFLDRLHLNIKVGN